MSRILILGSFSRSLVQFRGHLIRRLLDEGHEVVAVAPDFDDDVRRTLRIWGARCRSVSMDRTGINPIQDLETIWELHSLFATERPDIFFGYTIKPVVYGLFAAWMAEVPSRYAMITGVGSAFTESQNLRQYLLQTVASMLYRLSLKTSRRIIFHNPDDAYMFCARRLVDGPEPLAIVNGSGVDLDEYRPAPLPHKPSYLLIGRLLHNKGIREYARAARKIRRHNPEARFRLVGWPDDGPAAIGSDELDDWISDGTIEYLGHLDDVRPAIADASVYVLPSYREGTPRTVLEAMAMGRPIVTTDVPGCRETVEPGENGFLVPPRNEGALARAMTHFIGEWDLVESMGRASRRIAEKKFDVQQVTDSMLLTLELGQRRMPPPLPHDVA